MTSFFSNYFQKIHEMCETADKDFLDAILHHIDLIKVAGRKIIIAGNGGSAALSSHVAVDFTKAARVRAINFNEADLITCYANDYGYEHWLSQAFLSYADQGDLVILVSSSGQSANILNAAKTVREMGLTLATFSGFLADNPLRRMGNFNGWVDSQEYNVVEMTHHIWLLAIIDNYIARQN